MAKNKIIPQITTHGMIPFVDEYGEDGTNDENPIKIAATRSTPINCLNGEISRSKKDFCSMAFRLATQ